MIIQARHQHQLLPARFDELLAAAHADLFQRLDAIGDERRAHHQQLLHSRLGQLVQPRFGIGLDPLGPPKARLERHRPFAIGNAHFRRERLGRGQALPAIAHCAHLGRGILAAVGRLEVMRAGRVELLQMALGQTVEAQQQVIVILLQVRPGAGDQRIDVFRVIVERLQHAYLQRQLAVGHGLVRLRHHSGHRAVGELRIERRQRHLAHTLRGQALQHLGQGRLTVTHGNLDRAVRPMRDHRRLQATGQHHQR
ncbi:hypothetical protein D3C76_1125570 [compost metagenome]